MERTLAVVTGCVIASLRSPRHRSAGHAQDGVGAAGTPLRGEKGPDDERACELGAMGLL